MKRFRNIALLADNDSGMKKVLARAAKLAKSNGAKLKLIDVQPDFTREPHNIYSSKYLADIQSASTEQKLERLRKLWLSGGDSSVTAEFKVLAGTPFLEVIKEIIREKHDLLMKSAEERSRFKSILFGTTDMHLMRKCPCPLWVMKPTRKRKYQRVMAAVDPYSALGQNEDLNLKIMDLATSLTSEDNSELHIIHIWKLYGELILQGWRMKLPEHKIEQLLKNAEDQHKKLLNDLLSKYELNKIKHKIHILRGNAYELIPEAAHKNKIDLIVMGSLARSGVSGMFIGNTAEQVINQINCSVLTVKPEDFKTPVQID